MPKAPRLADVNCQPMRFAPGDRILVRTTHRLDKQAERKLKRTVAKWSGLDESLVLVYSLLDMEIEKV